MLSRDYLLRQIERFAQVVAKIAGWKKDGFFGEALEELDAVLQNSGDTRRVLELLDEGQLNPPFPPEVPADLISAVADLTWEKAQLHTHLNQPEEAKTWQLKSLILLLATLNAERHILKMREESRAENLIQILGKEALPMEVKANAEKYFGKGV